MLPHNARQHQQAPSLPAFMSQTPSQGGFDNSYFNLDPSTTTKQMALLNAARIANGRSAVPSASQPATIGTSSGTFLGGSIPGQPITNDTSNGTIGMHSNFPFSNNHPPPQSNSAHNTSVVDPSMSQPNQFARNPTSAQSLKQRQRTFLTGLASVMVSRNTPLPPAITGVPYPANYDPTNSPWKIIETSSEPGSFRLAGKDIDLFRLWGIVYQAGGGTLVSQQNAWNMILHHFDLPEQFPTPQQSGQPSVAHTLGKYYMAIIQPFEDAYKRNTAEQQRRATLAGSRQGVQTQQAPTTASAQGRPLTGPSGAPQPGFPLQMHGGTSAGMVGLMGQSISGAHTSTPSTSGVPQFPIPSQPNPQPPHQRPPSSSTPSMSSQGLSQSLSSALSSDIVGMNIGQQASLPLDPNNILDQDVVSIKRKLDSEEPELKRARQKTAGSEPPESSSSTLTRGVSPHPTTTSNSEAPSRPRPQPSRRKIEYVPLAREVETYGGRDLKLIDDEMARLRERRLLRDINDWGTVDIEGLTMSIRSRLSTELSYALTTFTLLSTMRGQTPGSGFPIFQCVDLLDEVLDLLEDESFGEEDTLELSASGDSHVTHRELVDLVHDEQTQLFAGLIRRQGSKDPDKGPRQRPGNIVLTILNIIRNLSTIPDNVQFLAQHERLLDVILRVCGVTQDVDKPHAASPVLSVIDLITARKDVMYTLTNIAGLVQFSSSSIPSSSVLSKITIRMATRAFALVSSYLVHPAEALSPLACVQLTSTNGHHKPPSLPDTALEVFTRLSQTDSNRQVISKVIPQASIWRLFEALVHRLPILDGDFQLMTRELWLSYLEKTIMAIYSLGFLAPPELKQKVKTDRSLGFPRVMLRIVQKFLTNSNSESRAWFSVSARRAIEAMKVVDDGEDSFDTAKSTTVPTMAFGMGYGEVAENGKEKGTGLLGGHRDVTLDLLMLRDLDEVMFSELESLARVEC